MNIAQSFKMYFYGMLFVLFLLLCIVVILVSPFMKGSSRDGDTGYGSGITITADGPAGDNWYSKSGVSLNGVRETTLDGLQDLADWYKSHTGEDLLITSGTDGDMHADAARGSHYSGDKLDVASDALENAEFRQAFIDYAESKGIIVLDEYSSPSANSTGGHLDLNFRYYHGNVAFAGLKKDNSESYVP